MPKNHVDDTAKLPAELLDALDDGMPIMPPLHTIARYTKSVDTTKIPDELLDVLDDTYIPVKLTFNEEQPFNEQDTAKVIPIKE